MPCFSLSHSRRSFSVGGPDFSTTRIQSASVLPVRDFTLAREAVSIAKPGCTLYGDFLEVDAMGAPPHFSRVYLVDSPGPRPPASRVLTDPRPILSVESNSALLDLGQRE